jgi:flagellar motor switch protein FliN/FliY
MSEAAAPAPSPASGEYLKLWAESFSKAMTQIAGAPVPCVAKAEAPADLAPAGEQDPWALVTSSGGVRGEMRLRLPAAAALHLAQVFTSEPLTPEVALTEDHKEAVLELLRQVAGLVSTSAKGRWGENQIRVEMVPAAPSWPPAETFWVQVGDDGPLAMVLEAGLSAALAAELRAEKTAAAKPEASAAAAPSAAATPSSATAAAEAAAPAGTMDLLMDVQLGVTMRFGSRRLLLREVLELSPGAVVELDRKVQEPVDLLLDGRLVARGEVVVIDGNYGLRVTDASPLNSASVSPSGGARDG